MKCDKFLLLFKACLDAVWVTSVKVAVDMMKTLNDTSLVHNRLIINSFEDENWLACGWESFII